MERWCLCCRRSYQWDARRGARWRPRAPAPTLEGVSCRNASPGCAVVASRRRMPPLPPPRSIRRPESPRGRRRVWPAGATPERPRRAPHAPRSSRRRRGATPRRSPSSAGVSGGEGAR